MPKIKEKVNVICLSNQLWDYPLWTNKKHVMSRLAERGNNVLFIDPPVNTGRVLLRQLTTKRWSLSKLLYKFKKEADSLFVFSPIKVPQLQAFFTQIFIKHINTYTQKYFDKSCKTILWIYHVEIENLKEYVNLLNYDILVYDCVDNYSAFPKYNTEEKKSKLINIENELATKADIVFCTAPGLVDRLKKYNQKTFYTPNVGDYERFSKSKTFKENLPDDIKNIPRPRIGFTGALDSYKFDSKLVLKLSKDYPSYSFVIIGPMALKDRESSIKELGFENSKNIYFLGTKDFKILNQYYAGFDAVIIPYPLNDYTVGGCFPVKFHEALAAEVPVIVTDLPAYKPFSDVCYISRSYDEFSQNIRRALEEDSEALRSARREVARANNWEGKVTNMINIIDREMQ